jgi:hypothetical protein
MARVALALIALIAVAGVAACGGSEGAAVVSARPIAPPRRSAAEDRALRALLLDLAERHLCDRLRGSFVALPDVDAASGAAGGASPSAGRWWIEACEVERRGDRVVMTLGGRGTTWVERSTEAALGTSFTVRGHLRFRADIVVSGEVDVAYSDARKRVTLWLTPRRAADARVVPLGAVPVEPDGGWSAFLGAVGGIFGDSVEERARPMVEEQGSAQMAERLARGFTFTADLCSGQMDTIVGALGNGEVPERPWEVGETRWLANQRVRLREGGVDLAGPFEGSGAVVHVDVEVERGEGVVVSTRCAGGLPEWEQTGTGAGTGAGTSGAVVIRRGTRSFVEVDTEECPRVLVMRPMGEEPVVLRYRAFALGDAAEPLVRCAE